MKIKKGAFEWCAGCALALLVAAELAWASELPRVHRVPAPEPVEISGVAAVPGGFAVVGDDDGNHGRIWPVGARFEIDPPADDLESIDVVVSAEGASVWLVLDEDERTVRELDGPSVTLSEAFGEVCNRGLEGMAARWASDHIEVAVLWEGGFRKPDDDAAGCRDDDLPSEPLQPKVAVFDWVPGAGLRGEVGEAVVLRTDGLNERLLPGQAFRAPDLVWQGDGFLVLLSSTDKRDRAFEHRWLQRFDRSGQPHGCPLKLESEATWRDFLRGEAFRCKNIEGLDWTIEGVELVMGFDEKRASELWVVRPPAGFWQGRCLD